MESDERDKDPVVEFYKKDLDLTLLRENLKLSVEDRFRKAMAMARFADELRRAGRAPQTDSSAEPQTNRGAAAVTVCCQHHRTEIIRNAVPVLAELEAVREDDQ